MSTYLRLLRFIKPHLRVFGMAILYMVGSTVLNGVQLGSVFVLADRIVTDEIIPNPAWLPHWLLGVVDWLNHADRVPLVGFFACTIPVLFLLKGLCDFWQSFFMTDTAQRVIRDLRQRLFDHFIDLSIDYHTKASTGTLMSRILYDTGIVQNSITEGFTDLTLQSLHVMMYLAIALAIDWKLSLVILVMAPLIGWPIARIGQVLKKLSHQSQTAMGKLTSTIHESLSGIRVIQAFLAHSEARAKFESVNMHSYQIQRKLQKRMTALSPLTEFIGSCAGAWFFWYGARQVLSGVMTLGTFLVFLGAMLSLIRPFKRLARLHGINQQALASAERIFNVLDTSSSVRELAQARVLSRFHREIRYEHVSFHYDQRPVLRDVSLTIAFGETLAVVGPSGGGKTTLMNLLPRFFDASSGRVRIDGIDVRHVTLSSLREQIGWVTQETFLFNDTVRENIAIGRTQASLENIITAAKMASAHSFISRLPKGYDTIIGERGSLLSGGERQRLAIARALLNDPPIIILDEATSQLDAESEHLITEALEHLTRERTVVIIAHRLSTVRLAQRIVLIQEGRIVESGSHDELLQKSPLYRRFCELQLMDAGSSRSSLDSVSGVA